MLPRAICGEGVPKPTGNAPRVGSIEGRPDFVWVILGDLDRFKRARVLGFIRPVVPLVGLLLYNQGFACKAYKTCNVNGGTCKRGLRVRRLMRV
jgi:hypothetical protein